VKRDILQRLDAAKQQDLRQGISLSEIKEIQKNEFEKYSIVGEEIDFDTPIYRIISVEDFMRIVKTKEIGLRKIVKWEDPYENFFWKIPHMITHGTITSKLDATNVQENIYGICWSLKKECDGLWRNYAKNGIQIKTTIRKFYDYFYNIKEPNFILRYSAGKVRYLKPRYINRIAMILNKNWNVCNKKSGRRLVDESVFLKRSAFSYEHEFRFIYYSPIDSELLQNEFYNVSIDLDRLIDEVTFSPFMDSVECYKLKECFSKHGISNEKIKNSDLYQFLLK